MSGFEIANELTKLTFKKISSDFRHTITVQHTAGSLELSRNPSSPNSPPGSPSIARLRAIARELNLNFKQRHLFILCFCCSVPSDGVKGKTWGPSTCHQRERGQIIAHVAPESHKRWSRSAPNLEKNSRPNYQLHEIGRPLRRASDGPPTRDLYLIAESDTSRLLSDEDHDSN